MHVGRRVSVARTLLDSWPLGVGLVVHGLAALWLTEWLGLAVPAVALGLLGGVAVVSAALGNRAAHERLDESRRLWGDIVHQSRSFGMLAVEHVRPQPASTPVSAGEVQGAHRSLLLRHVAWLTALRHQLRVRTAWERHAAPHEAERRRYRVAEYEEVLGDVLEPLLDEGEGDRVLGRRNPAAQLLVSQGRALSGLRERGLLDELRHVELEGIVRELSRLQAQCERLKSSPLPRPGVTWNRLLAGAFVAVLPYGLGAGWPVVMLTVVLGWGVVGFARLAEASENPFEGLGDDTPITALSRSIEIELRELLGETAPPPVGPVGEVLS